MDAKLTGMIWLLNPSRFGGQEAGKLTKNMGLVRARIETIKVELQGYDEEVLIPDSDMKIGGHKFKFWFRWHA